MELHAALDHFRKQETINKFSLSRLKNSGPGLIMPTVILKRIVDCVHAMKINPKEDLQLETRWSRANLYGDEILALIKVHCPIPMLGLVNISGTEPAGRTKCSRCGQKCHNSEYLFLCSSLCISDSKSYPRIKQEMPKVLLVREGEHPTHTIDPIGSFYLSG
jgi:hypothetical protein